MLDRGFSLFILELCLNTNHNRKIDVKNLCQDQFVMEEKHVKKWTKFLSLFLHDIPTKLLRRSGHMVKDPVCPTCGADLFGDAMGLTARML